MASELQHLIDEAEQEGWTVSKTNGNHLRFTRPGRRTVFGSATPGDHRAIANIRGKLRRAKNERAT